MPATATPHTVSSSAAPTDDMEPQLKLLRLLESHPEYSQRELSSALGLSLGKTHYVLKALLGKGLVIAKNFQRSNRKLGYLYVLTPQGVGHRAMLTKAFLARKEAEFETLRQEIETLKSESRDTPPSSDH